MMDDGSGEGEGDNVLEGDIFLADEDEVDPIDPTQSLNFLRRQHLQMAGRRRQGSDGAAEGGKKEEKEEEDKLDELRSKLSSSTCITRDRIIVIPEAAISLTNQNAQKKRK